MPQIPQWRSEPEPVWIFCKTISEIPSDVEVLVQFDINGEENTAFVPKQFVDTSKRGLQGFIIADVEGGFLIDTPAESFTAGPRYVVMDSEKDSVLVSG